jgi:hypothetical protein
MLRKVFAYENKDVSHDTETQMTQDELHVSIQKLEQILLPSESFAQKIINAASDTK